MGVKVRERPKGSGVWWVVIDHKKKRKSKRIGTKEAALTAKKKIEAKITLDDFGFTEETKFPSFKKYADYWLREYVLAVCRPTTYERYSDLLEKHVYPTLGTKNINEIQKKDIRKLLLALNKKGYSKSTICLAREVISGPLGYAVDEELLQYNPVSGILKRLKLNQNGKRQIEPLNHQEVELFLKTCLEVHPEHYTFFLCAFRTGMRLGELLALVWGDIDWNSKFIHVERSYKRGCVGKTKNNKSRRVDMSDHLAESLKQLLTQRKREALACGKGELVEIIFHQNSRHMEQNYIRKIFKRILRKAGIRDIRLHDTRHTFASLLLSNGESPVYVKEQLGHSSIQMTVDVYGHLIPSSNREAVNCLDAHATIRNLCATGAPKKPVTH